LTNPAAADDIAAFGGPDSASAINYNVPLPGTLAISRVTPLIFPDPPDDVFLEGSKSTGSSLRELGVVEDEGNIAIINAAHLTALYREVLPDSARPSLRAIAGVNGEVAPLLSELKPELLADRLSGDRESILNRRHLVTEEDVELQRRRKVSYLDRLTSLQEETFRPSRGYKFITMPVPGPGNSMQEIRVDHETPSTPRIAIVETWEFRSYLGDYGLGRTLQTFSLLPGERTTITVETWRSDSAMREDATSIFDSSDTAAQSRFASTLMNQTGSAFQDQGGWSLSVGLSASAKASFFGLVEASASLNTGFAANHSEASQRWSNNLTQTASEHAAQVNNSRQQAVQSSSTTTTQSGSTTTTVREIANTNLRRVLNFVFRELNQTYETYVILRDIQLAFYNGRAGSADIAPIGDLRPFLERHVKPALQTKAAQLILAMCAQRLDYKGEPVATLQVGRRPNGSTYEWEDAKLGGDGELDFPGDPLSTDYRWRFRPGPLNGPDAPRAVNGLITQQSSVVVRTDNLVVEALLGQADALDPYASALQALDLQSREADRKWREVQTEKATDALEIVDKIADTTKQVDAYERMLVDKPDIEVVPVAAVNNNNKP
jgi:hypothetical protein